MTCPRPHGPEAAEPDVSVSHGTCLSPGLSSLEGCMPAPRAQGLEAPSLAAAQPETQVLNERGAWVQVSALDLF